MASPPPLGLDLLRSSREMKSSSQLLPGSGTLGAGLIYPPHVPTYGLVVVEVHGLLVVYFELDDGR